MSPLMVQGGLANDGNASATKIRVIEADRRPQSYAGRIVFASRHVGDAGSRRAAPPIFQSVSFRQGQAIVTEPVLSGLHHRYVRI